MGGSKRARRAVCVILGSTVANWEASGRESYRRLLLSEGIEAGEDVKESKKQGVGDFESSVWGAGRPWRNCIMSRKAQQLLHGLHPLALEAEHGLGLGNDGLEGGHFVVVGVFASQSFLGPFQGCLNLGLVNGILANREVDED